MQTVFEIFDPVTGATEGYKTAEGRDTFLARMDRAGYVRDYLPASAEGFYVVDMRGSVKAGPFLSAGRERQAKADAELRAMIENQANDYNSFSVVEHRLS